MEAAVATQTKQNGSKRVPPVLTEERFALAEQVRQQWNVNAEAGTAFEDVLDPAYWAHVAAKFSPLDEIRIVAEDGRWIAYLIVLFAERNFAQIIVDRYIEVKANAITEYRSDRFLVDWKGPQHKFCVIRRQDNKMLHSACATRDEATQWMQQHEKTART